MAPVFFTIWLELVLNTLVDAPFLSAAYTHVLRNSTYILPDILLFLFFLFYSTLSNSM